MKETIRKTWVYMEG